jgi:signal transduction histidine kinase
VQDPRPTGSAGTTETQATPEPVHDVLRRFSVIGAAVSAAWSVAWAAWGLHTVALVVGSLAIVFGGILFWADRLPTRPAAQLLVTATYFGLMVPICATGGAGGRIALWLAVIPVSCALLLATRDAVLWGAIVTLTFAVLWAIELAGVPMPNLVPPEQRQLLDMASDISALIAIVALAAIATGTRELARARVEQSHRALEQTATSLQSQNRVFTAVLATGDRLRLQLDLPDLLNEICRSIADALGWRYVVLSLRDEDSGTSRIVAAAGYDAATTDSLLQRAPSTIERQERLLRLGERISNSYYIHHSRRDEVHATASVVVTMPPHHRASVQDVADAWHADDVLMVPIELRGRVLGVISPDVPRSGRRPGLDSIQALEVFANQAAIAIENAHLLQAERETSDILKARSDQLEQAYRDLQASQQHLLVSEKMAALGRVTAGIAHEINSPLGGIMNSLQLARDLTHEYERSLGDPDVSADDHRQIADELKQTLALAEQAATRVGQFVRNIKAQTRAQAESHTDTFEVQPETESTMQLLAHLLRERGVRPVLSLQPWLRVRGDASRFALVLQNLVTNAMDAYEDRGGEVHVRASQRDGRVVVEVQDFGAGIPQEIRSRIFDYLFTTKDVGRGTGLGLSIVHSLVTGHFRGEIHVASEVGVGTTFTVVFPLSDVRD